MVPPVVAEVVGVEKLADAAIDEGRELDVLRRGHAAVRPHGIRNAVALVASLEVPEMIIFPAHRGLDNVVQHLQAGGDRDIDPAPDGGLDILEDDMDARDGLGGHAASLAGSGDQFHGMISSQRDAGQPSAIFAMTSAM